MFFPNLVKVFPRNRRTEEQTCGMAKCVGGAKEEDRSQTAARYAAHRGESIDFENCGARLFFVVPFGVIDQSNSQRSW